MEIIVLLGLALLVSIPLSYIWGKGSGVDERAWLGSRRAR